MFSGCTKFFYGLFERWGWPGHWEWGEDRRDGKPYLALPIRWADRTLHARELASLEKAIAMLSDPPSGPSQARRLVADAADRAQDAAKVPLGPPWTTSESSRTPGGPLASHEADRVAVLRRRKARPPARA